uniref:Uncharacterized protein n=1 Tax=Cucumis melo TaxID=3656 RepID=A0A9I9E271_CUCME
MDLERERERDTDADLERERELERESEPENEREREEEPDPDGGERRPLLGFAMAGNGGRVKIETLTKTRQGQRKGEATQKNGRDVNRWG